MKFLVRYEAVVNGATKENFFLNTEANFSSCETPERAPDYVSKSGSVYWYTDEGVVRAADHWLGVASCKWTLDGADEYAVNLAADKKESAVAGFCEWSGFSRAGFIEEEKEMPKGARAGSYKCVNGVGYKIIRKAA